MKPKSTFRRSFLFITLLFSSFLAAFAQPANDLCADAISVSCGDEVEGTNAPATHDNLNGCSSAVASQAGVWYMFEGTDDEVTVATCGGSTNFDTELSVYSGFCGNLSCVAGNDDACDNHSSV